MSHGASGLLQLMPICAIGFVIPSPAWAQEADAQAGGDDISRPTRRFDIRVERESGHDEQTTKLTLRYDHPIRMAGHWQLNLRADVPLQTLNDEHGEDNSGLGDILLHAVFAHEVRENQGFGFGAQLILPTASPNVLGKGKWRVRPMAGYRWSLPLKHESFFQLLRYDASFAGDDRRTRVKELQFAPNLEIGLRGSAYASLFPNPDIRYNFVTHELFVPINVEVGKSIGRSIVSVEVSKGLVRGDHPPFDWRAEARLGVRF